LDGFLNIIDYTHIHQLLLKQEELNNSKNLTTFCMRYTTASFYSTFNGKLSSGIFSWIQFLHVWAPFMTHAFPYSSRETCAFFEGIVCTFTLIASHFLVGNIEILALAGHKFATHCIIVTKCKLMLFAKCFQDSFKRSYHSVFRFY